MKIDMKELIDLIAKVLDVNADTINGNTDLSEDIDIDSITILELVAEIEDKYDITVQSDMIKQFTKINNIVNIIETFQ